MSCITVCFTYSLRMAIFEHRYFTSDTCRVWWGIYISLCYKFPAKSNSERILKIGKYLVKLWARVRCLVFLTHSVLSLQTTNRVRHRPYVTRRFLKLEIAHFGPKSWAHWARWNFSHQILICTMQRSKNDKIKLWVNWIQTFCHEGNSVSENA